MLGEGKKEQFDEAAGFCGLVVGWTLGEGSSGRGRGRPGGSGRAGMGDGSPQDPRRENAENMYYFSELALTLNEHEEGVAPTDSRLRPDQRLMEKGHWDEANTEKQRLEEKQRVSRRRRLEACSRGCGSEDGEAGQGGGVPGLVGGLGVGSHGRGRTQPAHLPVVPTQQRRRPTRTCRCGSRRGWTR